MRIPNQYQIIHSSHPLNFSILLSSSISKMTLNNSLQLNDLEREFLKMFLWYELYIYLSNTLNLCHKEDDMFNPKIIRLLLINLLQDDDHTLQGIGYTTHIHEDVLHDILYEINDNPSVSVTTKIIEYYIIAKRQEYTEFIRKIFQWTDYNKAS